MLNRKLIDNMNMEAVLGDLNTGAQVDGVKISEIPLQYASCRGNKAITELLIMRGAEVDKKGQYGETALHRSASVDCSRLLLENKANPNNHSVTGWTPLMFAVQTILNDDIRNRSRNSSKVAIVKLLLDHKAEPVITRNVNTRPFIAGFQEILDDLVTEFETQESSKKNRKTCVIA